MSSSTTPKSAEAGQLLMLLGSADIDSTRLGALSQRGWGKTVQPQYNAMCVAEPLG
ncbi:MAG: hypothetical protein ACP5JG_15175 [Anaerolineae bacterium]